MEVLTRADGRIAESLDRGEFFWLDLERPSPAEVELIGQTLGLRPLAVADTQHFEQRPKLDDFGDHVLLVFFSVREGSEAGERAWRPIEHHVYVSGDWIVTVRQEAFAPLNRVRERFVSEVPDAESRVLHAVLRSMCDAFEIPIRDLERRVDDLEERVFRDVARLRLESLYRLRQELQELLRRMAAQRDTFPTVETTVLRLPGLTVSSPEELSDVRDQLVEVAGELQRQHDDVSALISLYFSASGERLNRLAYRLTILATFFVIATLITGFFGQNFGWLVDSIDSQRDFLVYGVGGLVVPLAVFASFVWWRRRDWL